MNNGYPTTVMVVEPDAKQREELLQAIRRAGFVVIACADGEQALQTLQRRGVEAIVAELLLPGLRGEVLARQVHTTSPETVILVQSACTQIDRIVEVFRCGAQDFLRKPVAPDEVVFRFKRLLLQRALAREDRDLNAADNQANFKTADSNGSNLRLALRNLEKRHVLRVLEDCGFDKHAAAAALGIGLSSLYRKLDELRIPTGASPHDPSTSAPRAQARGPVSNLTN